MAIHERIELSVPDAASRRAHISRPDGGGSDPGRGVVVLHDATGFRSDTVRHCDRFADEGYVAIAPDLFAGGRPGCIVAIFRSMLRNDGEAFAVIDVARQRLASDPQVDPSRIGVVGFCMGGGFALVSAADQPFAVAAPFYGAVPRRRERLDGVCPLIAQYGAKDLAFSSHAQRLAGHLAALEVPHELVVHEGVGHSFMNAHTDPWFTYGRHLPPLYAGYDQATEADAWPRLLRFFDTHLA